MAISVVPACRRWKSAGSQSGLEFCGLPAMLHLSTMLISASPSFPAKRRLGGCGRCVPGPLCAGKMDLDWWWTLDSLWHRPTTIALRNRVPLTNFRPHGSCRTDAPLGLASSKYYSRKVFWCLRCALIKYTSYSCCLVQMCVCTKSDRSTSVDRRTDELHNVFSRGISPL